MDRVSRVEDLGKITRFLDECRDSTGRCEIDFSPLFQSKTAHPSPELMDWIGNLLQASYGDVPLALTIPADKLGRTGRTGLISTARLRRSELTDIRVFSESALLEDVPIAYGRSNAHLVPAVTGTQFAVHDPHNPWGLISPARFERMLSEAIQTVLVNAHIEIPDSWWPRLAEVTSGVAVHLLDNVKDHAFVPSPNADTRLPENRIHSILLGSITRGGGAKSFNRLHLRVIDYGLGLLFTLRPKLLLDHPEYSARSGSQLLKDLLRDELPPYGQASHIFGYPEILRLLAEVGGVVTVTTPDDRSDNTLNLRRSVSLRDGIARVRVDQRVIPQSEVPFLGTTVHMTIAVPAAVQRGR